MCAQCGQAKDDIRPKVQTKAEEAREYEYLEGVVEGMRERDRRTIYRRVERGEDPLGHIYGSDDESDDDDTPDTGTEGSDGDDTAEEECSNGCAQNQESHENNEERCGASPSKSDDEGQPGTREQAEASGSDVSVDRACIAVQKAVIED